MVPWSPVIPVDVVPGEVGGDNDCYEKDICSDADKVWALEDVRVLAERKNKCVVEREALRTCAEPAN